MKKEGSERVSELCLSASRSDESGAAVVFSRLLIETL